MPDALSPILAEAERRQTADRLWRVIDMVRRHEPAWRVEEALVLTVRGIEPQYAQYEERDHV